MLDGLRPPESSRLYTLISRRHERSTEHKGYRECLGPSENQSGNTGTCSRTSAGWKSRHIHLNLISPRTLDDVLVLSIGVFRGVGQPCHRWVPFPVKLTGRRQEYDARQVGIPSEEPRWTH